MELQENIRRRFVAELKKFKRVGYRFDAENALRPGTQYEAFDAYLKGIDEGHVHGYFDIPTGVGKTALAVSIIKCYLNAVKDIENAPRVLMIEPKVGLVGQTARSIAKFLPELAPMIQASGEDGQEIDWENSRLGVHYANKKHAHLKREVLVSTYQSLSGDKKNKHFGAEDYGLILYDEGHNLTAEQFGKATTKFSSAIQLAVTATPEYSETKTVGKKLAWRYYQITIKEAIKRGDLCQVRPVLLRTGHNLDPKEVRRLIEDQHGRKLTARQIESLLNRETRNKAAVKTYLLGEDPDTGERYFGQTGMIFAGGITHCNDFARQMEQIVSQLKYREFRQWLKDEGVALIAPVHSQVPKEGWPLAIGGVRKKLYTKDQILKLHDEGKILLVISDQELKEGSDFPRDSFVLELVDRLSLVDTTQRFGRGFRLNMGDPDKFCTAINLVDENTYELYKDDPQMLPIYCAEILDGAEFRAPTKRKHLLKRPTKAETLEYELITDIEAVRAVSEKYKRRKIEAEEGKKKPDDVWSGLDLSNAIGSRMGEILLRDLYKQLKNQKAIEYRSLIIPLDALVRYRYGSKDAMGIKKSWGEKIAEEYLSIKKKPANVWSDSDLAEHLGKESGDIILKLYKRLQREKIGEIKYLSLEIPANAFISYENNGKPAVGILEEYGQKIVNLNHPKNNAGALEPEKLAALLGVEKATLWAIINKLWKQLENSEKATADYYGLLKIPRNAFVEFTAKGRSSISLNEEYGNRLAEAYRATKRPEGVWSSNDLAARSGMDQSSASLILKKLSQQLDDPATKRLQYKDLSLPKSCLKKYLHRAMPAIGIEEEWAEKLVNVYKTTDLQKAHTQAQKSRDDNSPHK